MSNKASAKSSGQKTTLKQGEKHQLAAAVAETPMALPGEDQLLASAELQTINGRSQTRGEQQPAAADGVADEASTQASELAQDEEAAQAVLTAIQDGVDVAGNSLLVAAETASEQKDEDDKAGAWHWSDVLPWVAVLGGIALIARSSNDDEPIAASPTGTSGVVWDTPVANAIVFRDSDGDGMWKDVNSDGKWQDGDEYITSTNNAGEFTDLAGSGLIVATSLDRLVSTNGKSGEDQVLVSHTRTSEITDSQGKVITGDAIDIGADLAYATADDYVWSGAYAAPTGSGIYVTGVSTLVAAYLAEQGNTAPTQADVITAANELAELFASDYTGGAITTYTQAIEFFTSSLNAQVTKLMGAVAGQAQAEGAEGADLMAAVNAAIAALAQAAIDLSGSNADVDVAFSQDNPIDLTVSEHLQEIFGYDALQAQAYAAQTANAGPAVYTIWFNQDGSAVASPDFDSIATITRDGPLGNITVLASEASADVALDVQPEAADSLVLQGSLMQVVAAEEDTSASLNVAAVSGLATGIRVQATGDGAQAYADVNVGAADYTHEVQYFALREYLGAQALVEGDELAVLVEGETLTYAITSEDLAADSVVDTIMANLVTALNEQAQDVDLELDFNTEYDPITEELFLVWGDTQDHEQAAFTFNGETPSGDGFSIETLHDGNPVVGTVEGEASLNINGDVLVVAAADHTLATVGITGSITLEGDISVTAVGDYAAVDAQLDSETEDGLVTLVDTNITVSAEGAGACADVHLHDLAGTAATVSVDAQGQDAATFLHLSNAGESTDLLTLGSLAVTASNGSVDASASASAELDGNLAITSEILVSAAGSNGYAYLNGDANSIVLGGGDLTLRAEGTSAQAEADLYNASGTTAAVSVDAEGESAYAYLDLEAAASADLSLASLSVNASNGSADSGADAYAYVYGQSSDSTVSISGDISVAASGQSANAYLDVNDSAAATQLGGGAISVTADGEDADANAYIYNASGSTGAVSVDAEGESAYAYLDLEAAASAELSLASLSVNASNGSADSGADAYAYVYGQSSDSTVSISGDISVAASGQSANAYLDVNDSAAATQLGGGAISVTADGEDADANAYIYNASGTASDITVTAEGGSDGSPEVQGFDFLGYFSGDSLNSGDVFSFAIGHDTLTYTVTSGDAVADDVALLLANVIDSFNTQAASADLGITFASTFSDDMSGLFASWSEVGNQPTAVLSVNDTPIELSNNFIEFDGVNPEGSSADLYLEVAGDSALTLQGLTVSADAVSDARAVLSGASGVSTDGEVAITGDILVSATGDWADASMDVNREFDGVTTLGTDAGGSAITISAEGHDANASATIYNASGTAGAVSVDAEGESAYAYLDLEAAASADLSLASLSVNASNGSADSGADAYAYVYGQSSDSTVSISGDISVAASGQSANAYLDVNDSAAATQLGGGAISVTADGEDADANAYIYNASGSAGAVTVDAEDDLAYGRLDIEAAAGAELSLSSVNVSAGNSLDVDAQAYLSIYAESSDSTVAITGDIRVTAEGASATASADIDPVLGSEAGGSNITVQAVAVSADAWLDLSNTSGAAASVLVGAHAMSADAEAYIVLATGASLGMDSISVLATSQDTEARLGVYANDDGASVQVSGPIVVMGVADNAYARAYLVDEDTRSGDVTLGGEAGGSGIGVVAAGDSAEAHAHIYNAGGAAGSISVMGDGVDSYAHIELEVGAGRALSVDSLTVKQIDGDGGEAYAQVWTASESADVAITGDITVSAIGTSTEASAELNDGYAGTVTLGANVSGDLVGSEISVAATDSSADASLSLDHGQGAIGSIAVQAGAEGGAPSNFIIDGGDDQYDDGNYIGSDFASDIAYSPTVVSGNFGVGSENVAVYQDSLFGMLVTGNGSDTFTVSGELGADGDGAEDLITEVAEYNGYRAIFQRTYGDDASINRVFIYQASDAVQAAELDGDTDNDDLTISGLSGVDTFAYFVLFGDDNVNPISEEDLTAFFHATVDNVLDGGDGPLSIEAMQTAFYEESTQSALRGEMGLYEGFTNDDDGLFALVDTPWTEDASANADLDFSGDVQGNISVLASSDSGDASLQLYSAAADGRVNLLGSELTVGASGERAEAHAWISSASGEIGEISVEASALYAQAGLSVASAVDGQHQQQRVSFAGAESLTGFVDSRWIYLTIEGETYEYRLDQSYYTSRDDALTEIVRALRADVMADTGATLSWAHDALLVTWPDYAVHAPVSFETDGNTSNVHTTIAIGHAVPVLAFGGDDVTVRASAAYAEAYASVTHASGEIGDISVLADAPNDSCDANANAEATLGLNGALAGDVIVAAANGEHNFASLDLHTDGYGSIGLAGEDQAFTVTASAEATQAWMGVDGLAGMLGSLQVTAGAADAQATAQLRFTDGGLQSADVEAASHTAEAVLVLDQTVRGGEIDVSGEGHAALTFVVDEHSATPASVDLTGMRSSSNDVDDHWGYADIDLMARWEGAGMEAGAGRQLGWSGIGDFDFDLASNDLWNDRMVVEGFNADRDSINLLLQGDPRLSGWADDVSASQRQEVAYEANAYTASGSTDADFENQFDTLMRDATWYFDTYEGDAALGYYYGEITVDVNRESGYDYSYTRSFLVYDFDLATDGASGVIDLGTGSGSYGGDYGAGLGSMNVSDRYDLAFQTSGYLDQYHPVNTGGHVIENLTVGAYADGYNWQSLDFDTNVWLGDITVEALSDSGAEAYLFVSNDYNLELRQSDIRVTASNTDWEGSADAELRLDGDYSAITGSINSLTVSASESANARAYLYATDVVMHDITVQALDQDAYAYAGIDYSDMVFDQSVVTVQAGSEEWCEGGSADYARAELDIYAGGSGTIAELNVLTVGWESSADAQIDSFSGDIDQLNVVAEGDWAAACADVEFDNTNGANALQGIRVAAFGDGGPAWAEAWIHATNLESDIQMTGEGDIVVSAGWNGSADLDMDDMPVSGQVGQITVEASDGSGAYARIQGLDFSVTHVRDDNDATSTWDDSGIRVSAVDSSQAGLVIGGYGEYLDSAVVSAGNNASAYLSLDMNGYVDKLDIEMTGGNAYASVDITQGTYGGVVTISASSDDIDAQVDLSYYNATAASIVVDDGIALDLLLDVADQDIPYTSQATLLAYKVQIDGFSANDTIDFGGEWGDAWSIESGDYWNYEANGESVSLAQLFSDANAELDGTVDYYFGVSGGNGYLFHDEDGSGITTVVELLGVTTFSASQIAGYEPNIT